MIYLDAAYIAKFYIDEPDSERVRNSLESGQPGASCVHAIAEVASVFHRKLREGAIPQADCEANLWTWIPMTENLAHSTRKRLSHLPSNVFIRAADALHLTCAAEEGFTAIYSSDRHMVTASPSFGLRAMTL